MSAGLVVRNIALSGVLRPRHTLVGRGPALVRSEMGFPIGLGEQGATFACMPNNHSYGSHVCSRRCAYGSETGARDLKAIEMQELNAWQASLAQCQIPYDPYHYKNLMEVASLIWG